MMVEAPRPPTGPTLMDRLRSGSLLPETPRLNLDQATRRLLDAGMAPEELQQYVDQNVDLNYLLAQLPPETPPMRSPAEEEVKRINRSRIAGTTTGTPIYEQAVELLPPTPAGEEAAPAEEEPGMTTGTPIYEQRIADLLPTSTETPDETGGGETDTPDLRARAEERIKLFQDLFGSDEPTARDRAMQFAMIGLAIAAGQSPNALTNIASGLLAGTQAMTEAEGRRRAERRDLRSSAVTSVLNEIEAERKAAAEAAKRSGEDYQPTESYADAVLKMTDTLIKEDLAGPLEAKRLAQQLIDPLYGRGTPVDTGTVERGRQLVQQLRDSGRTDTEIARLVREAGLDPADLGVTDGQ
jgi:hypothetical protein